MAIVFLLIKAITAALVCFAAVLGMTAVFADASLASDGASCVAAPLKTCLMAIF